MRVHVLLQDYVAILFRAPEVVGLAGVDREGGDARTAGRPGRPGRGPRRHFENPEQTSDCEDQGRAPVGESTRVWSAKTHNSPIGAMCTESERHGQDCAQLAQYRPRLRFSASRWLVRNTTIAAMSYRFGLGLVH